VSKANHPPRPSGRLRTLWWFISHPDRVPLGLGFVTGSAVAAAALETDGAVSTVVLLTWVGTLLAFNYMVWLIVVEDA